MKVIAKSCAKKVAKSITQGALVNYFNDVLSIDIEGTEYYLTMNVEEEENYIEMTQN